MSNARRLNRGVVKQLSNLSIDEVSLVDRGANQHALISIAKRAPQADDYFEEVEKDWATFDSTRKKGNNKPDWSKAQFHGGKDNLKHDARHLGAGTLRVGGSASEFAGTIGGMVAGADHGGLGGLVAGGIAGGMAGHGVNYAAHAAANKVDPHSGGKVIHNHFYGGKSVDGDESVNKMLNVDDLFDVSKKKSSFGQGGQQDGIDEFSGDDPSGVLNDPNGEDGDIGPGGTIDGVETIEGEDTPPQKKKKIKAATDINPSGYEGGTVGKSEDFWKNVISKILDGEEFETEDLDDDTLSKHFPGPPGAGGMQQQPFGQQPPQAGMAGGGQMGTPPMGQSVAAQPMGMGQPMQPPMGGQPPMGQPQGGMPAQLPPDVVQYIQQLEQALDQLTGGSGDGSDDDSDQSASQSSGSDSGNDNNKFGKSGDFGMDETTFLTELAKSLDDDDADRETVNKAMEIVTKAERRAVQAETIAKQERDLRLEREFIAKAAQFNLPVKSTDLGPVLKRAAESLDEDDFKTIVKCLNSASASADYGNPYAEVGKRGGGDNADVLSQVDAAALELVGKASDLSPEAATLQVLNGNPAAYDEYLRDKRSRQF